MRALRKGLQRKARTMNGGATDGERRRATTGGGATDGYCKGGGGGSPEGEEGLQRKAWPRRA
ncbi:MAG: hypothetical protein LBF62_14940 [Tannerellaceae bacterium]|nr:hypothetical protein [Tannerellaceae bacterium]